MDIELTVDSLDVLSVRLRDGGGQAAVVSASPSRAAVMSLRRALEDATATGYGECFWPGFEGGQYWWIFRRDGDAVETVAMWTRGGASLWEHVFRATDAAAWLGERLEIEVEKLGVS